MLMIMLGLLTQEQAIAGIDFNTIGLLVGMMIIVSITRKMRRLRVSGDLVGEAGQGEARPASWRCSRW